MEKNSKKINQIKYPIIAAINVYNSKQNRRIIPKKHIEVVGELATEYCIEYLRENVNDLISFSPDNINKILDELGTESLKEDENVILIWDREKFVKALCNRTLRLI